ncbi:dicarboxylate/amino acid:cation symporter [Azospirillum sp. sgz302134]
MSKLFEVVTGTWGLLGAIAAGIALGLIVPAAGNELKPLAELFLTLMQMTVIPIMATALISSVGKTVINGDGARVMLRSAGFFALALAVAGVVTFVITVIVAPGSGLDGADRGAIAQAMTDTEAAPHAPGGLWAFFSSMIPANIVESASKGHILAIMTFSILLGLALGLLEERQGEDALRLVDVINGALISIMEWVLKGLPFGMFAIMASNAATLSWASLASAGKLILAFALSTAAVMALLTIAACIRGRVSPGRLFRATRDGMIIAASSHSELAAMPSIIRGVQELGVSMESAQLLVPLSTSLYKIGNIVFMIVMALFVTELYGHPLTISDIVILFFGCLLASPALDNESFSGPLALLSGVLNPIGLPADASLVMMMLIDPIVNPMLALLGAFGIATAPIFIEEKSGKDRPGARPRKELDLPPVEPTRQGIAETV